MSLDIYTRRIESLAPVLQPYLDTVRQAMLAHGHTTRPEVFISAIWANLRPVQMRFKVSQQCQLQGWRMMILNADQQEVHQSEIGQVMHMFDSENMVFLFDDATGEGVMIRPSDVFGFWQYMSRLPWEASFVQVVLDSVGRTETEADFIGAVMAEVMFGTDRFCPSDVALAHIDGLVLVATHQRAVANLLRKERVAWRPDNLMLSLPDIAASITATLHNSSSVVLDRFVDLGDCKVGFRLSIHTDCAGPNLRQLRTVRGVLCRYWTHFTWPEGSYFPPHPTIHLRGIPRSTTAFSLSTVAAEFVSQLTTHAEQPLLHRLVGMWPTTKDGQIGLMPRRYANAPAMSSPNSDVLAHFDAELVARALCHRHIVVAAPAQSGKLTAVQSWLSATPRIVLIITDRPQRWAGWATAPYGARPTGPLAEWIILDHLHTVTARGLALLGSLQLQCTVTITQNTNHIARVKKALGLASAGLWQHMQLARLAEGLRIRSDVNPFQLTYHSELVAIPEVNEVAEFRSAWPGMNDTAKGALVGLLEQPVRDESAVKRCLEPTLRTWSGGAAHVLPNQTVKMWDQDAECTICLDTLSDPVLLHCGHIFCGQCIVTHSGYQMNCPTCRAPIKRCKGKLMLLQPGIPDASEGGGPIVPVAIAGVPLPPAITAKLEALVVSATDTLVVVGDGWDLPVAGCEVMHQSVFQARANFTCTRIILVQCRLWAPPLRRALSRRVHVGQVEWVEPTKVTLVSVARSVASKTADLIERKRRLPQRCDLHSLLQCHKRKRSS